MTAAVQMARPWLGYLEHQDTRLLHVYRANAGKGGCTVFGQIITELYPRRYYQTMPWCAVFVHAVYLTAYGKDGAAALLGKPHPGTRVLARRMRRRGLWRGREYRAKPGDIIFCTGRVDNRISHCGIVEQTDGDLVITIEGNTVDPSGTFPKDRGGAVARRTRTMNDPRIVGYAEMGV